MRRPIRALPVVGPEALRRSASRPAFPFGDTRSEYFYLGRGAVWHAAKRLGLDHGEVLVPAYHHGVEVEALLDAGVHPRFFNVRRNFDVDLDSLASRITPHTRAIYVIHYAGFPQPMEDILAIARSRHLAVVEDCALALFSASGWRPLGTSGDAAIFCLYKTLPVPNGGVLWMPSTWRPPTLHHPGLATDLHQMVSTATLGLERSGIPGLNRARSILTTAAEVARSIRSLPVDHHPVGHRHFIPGQQHLSITATSRWLARRADAGWIVERRRTNYYALLGRLHDVAPPMVHELGAGVCPLFYPLWCDDKRAVLESLAQQGVEAIDFWREGSRLVRPGAFPDVDALRSHVLELPIHQDLDREDIEAMAEAVRRALHGVRT
jgi:hypothetical protein